MASFTVGYFVGSLSSTSLNRKLANALVKLAPPDLTMREVPIRNLALYSSDYDKAYPPEGVAFKQQIAEVDAVMFVTPEYNRSIPGSLKNAIEAYIQFTPGLITDDGKVTEASTEDFLRNYMKEFAGFIGRVYTAIPRTSGPVAMVNE